MAHDLEVAPKVAALPFHNTAHLPERGKRLFIDVQHGLGNRLRALVCASVIAQRTGRDLVVIWRPDDHCQARLGDLFLHDFVLIEDAVADVFRKSAARVYNYMEIEPGSCFNEPVLPHTVEGDIYIRSAYPLVSPHADFAAESLVLRSLRPVKAVLDLVDRVAGTADVAVHIRMATGPAFDHLSFESPQNWPAHRHAELTEWRKKSDISRFVTRLDQLVAQGQADRIFAAADLPASYAALRDRYGSRVAYLARDLYDRSALQAQYALADLILLASARYFLGSNWSSFSDIAQRIAGEKRPAQFSGLHF